MPGLAACGLSPNSILPHAPWCGRPRPLAGRQTADDHFEFLSETSVKVSSLRWIESNPPSPEMAVRIPTFVNETFD